MKLPRKEYTYLISYILYEPYQHRFCYDVRIADWKVKGDDQIEQIKNDIIDQIKRDRGDLHLQKIIILNITLLSSKWVWK